MGELTISSLLRIQNGISWFVSITLLCMVLYFSLNRNQKLLIKDEIVFLTILFLATFATGVLFEIDRIYLWFDHWTGMANLSWIIGWVLVNLGNYAVILAYYRFQSKPAPKWLHCWFAFTVMILISIYWNVLRHSEVRYPRIFARNLWELFYIGVSTAFCVGVCLQLAVLHNRLYRTSSDLVHKIRYFFVQAICFPGSLYYFGRFYMAKLSLYNDQRTVVSFFAICIVVQVMTGAILGLPFLPPKLLLLLVRPLTHISNQRKLRHLNRLRHHLLQAVHRDSAERLGDLDNFHALLIAILDCKVLLRRTRIEEENMQLIAVLEAVDDRADFDLLIERYASIGARIAR